MWATKMRPNAKEDASAVELWYRYKESGDLRLRNRLVLTYAPLVKYIAYKKLRQLPAHCEVEDLISAGVVALIEALDRFDPQKGATLTPYIWVRIRGAMIDELRRIDWAPRRVRASGRKIASATDRFSRERGRAPNEQELAGELDLGVAELRSAELSVHRANVGSLNRPAASGEEQHELIDLLPSDGSDGRPGAALDSAQARDRLEQAIERLPARERQVITLKYPSGLTFREIGQVLGVSEGRACQIHRAAKTKLAQALAHDRSQLLALA